jgi:hypothetical protein
MKRFGLVVAIVMLLGSLAAVSHAQVVFGPVVTYPTPVTAFYAPAPVYMAPAPLPVTTFYAPGPVFVRRPAVVPPRYFYPGQPVRNVFRRSVVVW